MNRKKNGALCVIVMCLSMFCLAFQAHGQLVAVDIDVVRAGENVPVSVIQAGFDYEFRIHIENGERLTGMQIGFKVWSPDGGGWQWQSQPGGWGPSQYVTHTPGSRMDPPISVFDLTGILVSEKDMNGVSPDTILLGGVSMMQYLEIGILEPMMSVHFRASAPYGTTCTICMDSTFVPPSSYFQFQGRYGGTIIPITLWPNGGLCWTVEGFPCGDIDGSGEVNISDLTYMVDYMFGGGPPPVCSK